MRALEGCVQGKREGRGDGEPGCGDCGEDVEGGGGGEEVGVVPDEGDGGAHGIIGG